MNTDLSQPTRVDPAKFTDELYFFDLAPDAAGRLWAMTSSGLFILDAGGKVLSEENVASSAGKFLRLPDGRMYLSSYDKLYHCITGPKPGLEFIREQTFIREMVLFDGAYWVGNHYGLFRSDTSEGLLAAFSFLSEDRLDSSQVYSITQSDTLVWVGTENGIHIFSPSGKRLPLPSSLREIAGEIIYSLSSDEVGRVWFAGNKGAGCITADQGRVIRFNSDNNLQSAEFNYNAVLRLPDGRLFLGGINGLNGLTPDDYDFQRPPPEVRLIELEVADTMFTPGLPPWGSIELNLGWQDSHVSGTVFSPGYLPEGMTGFSFFLEEFDPEWSKPSTNNRFLFRNLPPGTYKLWGKCIDPFKNEGKPELLLRITVHPPFWKTWWFLLLVTGLLVLGTGFMIKKIQEIKFRQKMNVLERQYAIEQERLRISRDMHDEIGSSLTQISILSELIKRQENKDEMRPHIERISEISGEVIDGMGEIIWAMNPTNDTLPIFASYLREHALEYLSAARIEGKVHFMQEFPPVPMSSEQRRNLFLVVKEALHNAVKHSQAGQIELSMSLNEELLELKIRDDGKGFDTSVRWEKGNGMANMKKRVDALGGTFHLQSASGRGTEISFSMRLPASSIGTKV
jgi:signal transduction histidine kinase